MSGETRPFIGLKGPIQLTFEQWKKEVDDCIGSLCGLGANDLPDWNYWTAWNDSVQPYDASREVVENACEEMGMDYDEIFGEE